MCPIKIAELNFEHLVIFEKDRTIFAAARENGNGHLRLFLINGITGNAYTRNGRAESWEELLGIERDTILSRIKEARENHIPVYRITGGTPGSHNN